MNKRELVAKVAMDVGLSKTSAEAAVESVIHGLVQTLKKGGSVSLTGFGSFKTAVGKAGRVTTFTAGKALK